MDQLDRRTQHTLSVEPGRNGGILAPASEGLARVPADGAPNPLRHGMVAGPVQEASAVTAPGEPTKAPSSEGAPLPESAQRRLRVLISAYSCAPGAGSERGIGWNSAREMARRHDVWVLTRAGVPSDQNQARVIERELAERPVDSLRFLYYDLPDWLTRLLGVQASSYVWQLLAYPVARRAHARIGFDLSHHVSWVRYYTPSLLARLPIPFVWGPVGGGDAMPKAFRRGLRFGARVAELQRRVLGAIGWFDPLVRMTARRATIALANSQEAAERIADLGADRIRIFGESGVDSWVLDYAESNPEPERGRLCFASMTRLLHWKGVHLGLEAFARLNEPGSVYWVVGKGPEEERLRDLVADLGIEDRVEFLHGLSRKEWMDRLLRCDALVHPCIYNSGSAISLEAMAMGCPVICLDRGGIRDQVSSDVGFRIRADDPEAAVAGLADAMRAIAADRSLSIRMGERGRDRVQKHFSWGARSIELDRVYGYAMTNHAAHRAGTGATSEQRSITTREI